MTSTLWTTDLLKRKKTSFVLWRPGDPTFTPALFIGNFQTASAELFDNFREIPLRQSAQFPDLWDLPASEAGLTDGDVYFYWFKVRDTDPYANTHQILYRTDPTAMVVDRRLKPPSPNDPGGTVSPNPDPAAVVLWQDGALSPIDPGGQPVDWIGDAPLSARPANDQLVIYELPTRWAEAGTDGGNLVGIGTFQDVLAQLIPAQAAPNFPTVDALNTRAHLLELGVNALELLPPADSDDKFAWGYGTANFFAADFFYGFPPGQPAPTASADLVSLIKTCHQQGLRFFVDAVMAFSSNDAYHTINYLDFHVQSGVGDPEQAGRDGFGGDLFKYDYFPTGYDPVTGQSGPLSPARRYLLTYLDHWMQFYRIDGLRLDSINNINNYDFVQEFKDFARTSWQGRGGTPERFLVVGEELSEPPALLTQNRLDGLWHENFKRILRRVVLGQNADVIGEPSFEWSVRKLIDCRLLGYADGTQAINYVTSHDIGGFGNERLFSFLGNNGVPDTEPRFKLAFACLLTAVGIPMILAGEEFADPQDLDINQGSRNKQIDPVNYARMEDDWRRRIFDYVARLVQLRTTSPALAVNDTQFLHVDFDDGKRVLVWQRGTGDSLVLVVANFSDFATPNAITDPSAEYVVPGWPAPPAGQAWVKVTQGLPGEDLPNSAPGREPLLPWSAKVYAAQ